jgi:hypothetical protein
MLFFQILLLGGYAYAHAISSRLSRRAQAWLHCGLLILAAVSLPLFARAETWTSHGAGLGDPVAAILLVLVTAVGLPYFLLASTGPLLQAWFWADSQAVAGESGPSPYRLYALSNIASFLALLSYPVAVEPWLALRTQAWMWSGLFLVYAASMIYCATAASPAATAHATPATEPAEEPAPLSVFQIVFWLALSACGSTLLLAATNHICQEVAVIPFLWIVPLSIYLLTFVLCFDGEGWYNRRLFALLAAVSICGACYMAMRETPPKIWLQALADIGIVLGGCMICHGELSRSKPEPSRLTQFYLALSAGGALGGVFTALIAPRIFNTFLEFPIAMTTCCLLGLLAWWRDGVFSEGTESQRSIASMVTIYIGAAALIAAATAGVTLVVKKPNEKVLLATRNFFGVLRVSEDEEDGGVIHKLTHGRTLHGLQFQDAERRDLPTTYYGPYSGIGIALTLHPKRFVQPGEAPGTSHSLKIGVIGLGTGTLTAWAKAGDTVQFYEINPSVERVSDQYFTYRKDSPAHVSVVLGDARVKLEEQAKRGESQGFDVLAVDAFSSDAIPAHLLTAECGLLYKYHLKPDGLLVLHISNRWLDLRPPARGLARRLGWTAALIDSDNEDAPGGRSSTWVVVTANAAFLKIDGVKSSITEWTKDDRPVLEWRDDFTSLWPVFQW